MAKWSLTGCISAGKYLGTVEAETKEEAIEKGWQLESCHVSVCHQCADDVEDPEIIEIAASEEN
jgi:hypothetical protein